MGIGIIERGLLLNVISGGNDDSIDIIQFTASYSKNKNSRTFSISGNSFTFERPVKYILRTSTLYTLTQLSCTDFIACHFISSVKTRIGQLANISLKNDAASDPNNCICDSELYLWASSTECRFMTYAGSITSLSSTASTSNLSTYASYGSNISIGAMFIVVYQ